MLQQVFTVSLLTCLAATAVVAETPLNDDRPGEDAKKILRQYSDDLSRFSEGFTSAVEKLQSRFKDEESKARKSASNALAELLAKTTRTGDLDAAILVRDTISAFDLGTPKPPTVGCDETIASLREQVNSLEETIEALEVELRVYRVENPNDAKARFRIASGVGPTMPFANGQPYFTNRKYVTRGIDQSLKFSKFFPLEGGGETPVGIFVTRPGVLYIAVAETDGFDPVREDGDWIDTGLRFSISSKTGSNMLIYMREVAVGRLVLKRVGFACPTILVPEADGG